jgi:hypothetical protein
MGTIVSDQEVSDFMSSQVVRATYDDNNDGTVDADSLKIIVDTSEGLFFATVRGIYQLPLQGAIDAFDKLVVLQIIHCQSIKRFPELFRNDTKVCDDVAELLKGIRKGELKLAHPLLEADQAATGPSVDSLPARGYEHLEHCFDD